MTITYNVEQLEHDTGTDLFLVKRLRGAGAHELEEADEVLELEVLDDLMTLRATDVDAYEIVCNVMGGFLERGAPMDRAEA